MYFVGQKFLGAGGDLALIYILVKTYGKFGLSIGEVTAIMLYVRTIMNNTGMLTNNIQQVAKVFGSAYELSVLIVKPNIVTYEGTERPEDLASEDDAQNKL